MGPAGTLVALIILVLGVVLFGAAAQPLCLVPIACFGLGVYLMMNDAVGAGWFMMLATFVSFIVVINIIASGDPSIGG